MQQQDGGGAYEITLSLGGTAGPVKLTVKDEGGAEGGSRLAPDCLALELQPGPPAAMAFEGPALRSTTTKGTQGCSG